jgi:RNA-directed DNA polymerase
MNMEQSMCAASGLAAQWEQIDWSQCEQKVRRLQARIVKATQEGRYGKVKALQWLLTHSFYGRVLAVKRVTHNKGKNTPGVDGAIWRSRPPGTRPSTLFGGAGTNRDRCGGSISRRPTES